MDWSFIVFVSLSLLCATMHLVESLSDIPKTSGFKMRSIGIYILSAIWIIAGILYERESKIPQQWNILGDSVALEFNGLTHKNNFTYTDFVLSSNYSIKIGDKIFGNGTNLVVRNGTNEFIIGTKKGN